MTIKEFTETAIALYLEKGGTVQFNDASDEYFLGPIVTYINNNRQEIIDTNSADYNNQLLKANLRDKFKGYDYGLSDW